MLQSVNKILPKKVLEHDYRNYEHDFTLNVNGDAQANKLTVKVNYMKEKEPQKITFSYSPVVIHNAPKGDVYNRNTAFPNYISVLVFAVLYKKEANGSNSEVWLVFCGNKYEPYYYRYEKGAKCTLSDELSRELNFLTATAFWGDGTLIAQSKVIDSLDYLNRYNVYKDLHVDKHFINIDKNGESNYGGNQDWFYNKDDTTRNDLVSKNLSNGGCGVIAACNLILYFQKNINGFENVTNVNIKKPLVSSSEYEAFVRTFSKEYLKPIDVEGALQELVKKSDYLGKTYMKVISDAITDNAGTYGVLPCDLVSAFKKYMSSHVNAGKPALSHVEIPAFGYVPLIDRAPIKLIDSYTLLVSLIAKSLSKKLPAIMLVGVSAPLFKARVVLRKSAGKKINIEEDSLSIDDAKERDNVLDYTSGHYMVITGMECINGVYWATLSSWGKKCFVDLRYFSKNLGLGGGILIFN